MASTTANLGEEVLRHSPDVGEAVQLGTKGIDWSLKVLNHNVGRTKHSVVGNFFVKPWLLGHPISDEHWPGPL